MENPVVTQIEELMSKAIGELHFKGKPVVLLEDAVEALENLEVKLWAIYQEEARRLAAKDEMDWISRQSIH